jgi:hypothetical protein
VLPRTTSFLLVRTRAAIHSALCCLPTYPWYYVVGLQYLPVGTFSKAESTDTPSVANDRQLCRVTTVISVVPWPNRNGSGVLGVSNRFGCFAHRSAVHAVRMLTLRCIRPRRPRLQAVARETRSTKAAGCVCTKSREVHATVRCTDANAMRPVWLRGYANAEWQSHRVEQRVGSAGRAVRSGFRTLWYSHGAPHDRLYRRMVRCSWLHRLCATRVWCATVRLCHTDHRGARLGVRAQPSAL